MSKGDYTDATMKNRDPEKLIDGRTAKCCYRSCDSTAQSGYDLPFFKYKPDEPYDEYYCGCWGWD